jgi:eukaryotic-like serine/threonine-protein kinase
MAQQVEEGQVLGGRFRLDTAFAADPLLHVWLAEDLELRREVVIKLLHPRWLDDADMVERFNYEALAAVRVDHENVAQTFGVEHVDGALFTVSEYVPGPTVAELLRYAPFPPAAVAAIGHQAAAGLAAAHAEGLAHRAVCPQNLLVNPNGRLCLIDFGSVRPLDAGIEDPDPVFPEPGVSDYWPPERHAGVGVDQRGDVYSLGLVMWEALTGAAEVGGSPETRPVRRLLTALSGGDSAMPRVKEILTRATAEQPEQRPTAAVLVEELAEICGVRPYEHLEPLLDAWRKPGQDPGR